jgi:hypothetical protein
MLTFKVYKLIHLFGIFGVFASLGAMTVHALNGGGKEDNPSFKLLSQTHGLALVFVLVGGFGMLPKLGEGDMGQWVIAKVLLWLIFGGLLILPYRRPDLAKTLWFLLPVLGVIAATLALYKPF